MRLPNGYGSITKLKGNRRKPYMVRLNASYTLDTPEQLTTAEDFKAVHVHENRKVLGYFKTKKEAIAFLDDYNRTPTAYGNTTFGDVVEMWKKENHLAENTFKNYLGVSKAFEPIFSKRIGEIVLADLQPIVNGYTPTRQAIAKSFLKAIYSYALRYDYCTKDISERVEIADKQQSKEKTPFTDEEINTLWNMPQSEGRDFVLILLYSGWRISELLTCEIDYDKNIMIGGVKTKAGKNRIVPIHPRIKPLLQQNTFGDKRTAYNERIRKVTTHTPHECRHTFISKLIGAGVPEYIVQKLVGHSSNVTNDVYTHVEYDVLYDAISKLK